MICLNSEGFPLIEELKNLRAITLEDMEKEKDIRQEIREDRKKRLEELKETIAEYNPEALFADGHDHAIMGYSTKGNVILNYCGINKNLFPQICDQNPEKPGLVTPGSRIPIISKKEMRKKNTDYILVLIWHFRKEVI